MITDIAVSVMANVTYPEFIYGRVLNLIDLGRWGGQVHQ